MSRIKKIIKEYINTLSECKISGQSSDW